jgi:hypothetical protein
LVNSTVANNGGAGGNPGGVLRQAGTVNLKNTIIANNYLDTGTQTSRDVTGFFASQGDNLIGNTANGMGFIISDVQNQDPQLGALADNGGTTKTHALLAASPAINEGGDSPAVPPTDQRGVARPQGAGSDIGAYEFGVPGWDGQTALGTNVTAALGTVSVTFAGVSQAGITMQVPVDPSTAGNLPGGYSFGTGLPAYEITTNAVYSAPVTVCLQVPGATNINSLFIFHSENGILVDRTVSRDSATRIICASVTSLSPFAVAQTVAPTAARVSVGGQVLTSSGGGISRAQVSIINHNGEIRDALTNSFGFFRFDEIAAGEVYVIRVRHRRFQFSNEIQIIYVGDEIADVEFIALPD